MSVHPLSEEVARLHGQGLGRNAIARRLQVSTRQVDRAALDAGVTFDAERTREAVAAHAAAAALQREELARDFRDIAGVIAARLLESEGLGADEVRDLIAAAVSASSADARLGRLSLDTARYRVGNAPADAELEAVVAGIRESFAILDETPLESLEYAEEE